MENRTRFTECYTGGEYGDHFKDRKISANITAQGKMKNESCFQNVNIEIIKRGISRLSSESPDRERVRCFICSAVLDYPSSGKVWIRSEDIFRLKEDDLAVLRRRKIGFIFQAFNLVSSINVWENVVLPLGLDGQEADESFVKDILRTLDIESKIHNLPNTLSGGQQQRVAIARALAAKPDIIFADEPTGNLDTKTSDEVIALLKMSAKKYGQTIVMITHDEDIAQIADRIFVIEDGKVVSRG